MKHGYQLLQQGTINPVETWGTLLRSISLNYMGAAGFEFGALPKALARLITSADRMVFGEVQADLPRERFNGRTARTTVLVKYWVRVSQEQDLIDMLANWDKASEDFEEWDVSLCDEDDIIFCIDEDHECFMWIGDLGSRLITETLFTSAEVLVSNNFIADSEFLTNKSPSQILRVQ